MIKVNLGIWKITLGDTVILEDSRGSLGTKYGNNGYWMDGDEIQVLAQHASGKRCPRSWRWVPELVNIEPWGEVSPRCAEVLANLD